jgi:hypothetical protein
VPLAVPLAAAIRPIVVADTTIITVKNRRFRLIPSSFTSVRH